MGKLEVMTDRVTGMIIVAPTPAAIRERRSWVMGRRESCDNVGNDEEAEASDEDVLAAPPVAIVLPIGMRSAARAIV